jgi:tetratricopeptide (TPR) repeat protein
MRDIRRARRILDADFAPRHLSELAATLATLEFESGNVSRAKKLFKKGAVDPNDNVVAQLQWASQNKIHEFRPEFLERSLTFEARASYAKKEKRWKDALAHCSDWLQDEPMSSRPAILGSYVASEMLQDYERSIRICEAGLRANPLDFTLLNNVAFSHAAIGNFEIARRFLERAFLRKVSKEEEVTFLATSGMIKIRQGQSEAGFADYNNAIELAMSEKLYMLAQLATVHYISELALFGSFLSSKEIEEVSNMMEDKRIIDEVHDIYLARLKPLLVVPPDEVAGKASIKLPQILLT